MLKCVVDERSLLLSTPPSKAAIEDDREWVADDDDVAEYDQMADFDGITGTAAIWNPEELPWHMAKGNGQNLYLVALHRRFQLGRTAILRFPRQVFQNRSFLIKLEKINECIK